LSRTLVIKDVHRRIFAYLARGDTPDFIAKSMGIRLKNLYKKLKTLDKYGYIKCKRVGKILNINLLPPAIKELSTLSMGADKVEYIRLHDLWIATKIISKPIGWSNEFVEKILEERSIAYTKHAPNNWKGLYFDSAPVKIRVTPNKILFKLPNIEIPLIDEPEHAKNIALNYLDDVVPRIESLLKVQVSKARKISISVSSQHIAFTKNRIAKYFLENDIDVRIYDDEGKLRVIVDKSNMNEELECIDKAHAEEDADKLQMLIKDTVTGKFDHRILQETISKSVEIQNQILQNQQSYFNDMKIYGKKVAAHAVSIEKLGTGIEKLTGIVERLERVKRPRRIVKKRKKISKESKWMKSYWKIIRTAAKKTGASINEVRKAYKKMKKRL